MQNDEPLDKLGDALKIIEGFGSGIPADLDSSKKVASAFETLIELYATDGALDNKAQASAMLATVQRMRADLAVGESRQVSLRNAYSCAVEACDHAIEAATKGSVNNVNLAAYTQALDETAQTALALGEADLSVEGTKLLSEAAEKFGEAAAGYRRLGRDGDAKRADIQALRARSMKALRA